jgi:MoaA/NifB/PqqE/SkfB family radical SAM enzyme
MIARGLSAGDRPILAQVIPIRRCNLACAYCKEYDTVSSPVATDEMLRRIDHLADLGTEAVTLSGGEPLLHPELDRIVRRIRERGMLASLVTNGYLLVEERIEELNEAGLDTLQISIDNSVPDEVSKKSLKVLGAKLRLLSQRAAFHVNVNTVLGAELAEPMAAVEVAREARRLGFSHTVGVLHDESGQATPLEGETREAFDTIMDMDRRFWVRARYNRFQKNQAEGQPTAWHCGAGGRYLYVCEDGLVHWCSQQRGVPALPLAEYTPDDILREAHRPKGCAPRCTISCVQHVSMIDHVREKPRDALVELFTEDPARSTLDDLPLGLRLLARAFLPVPGRRRGPVARTGLWMLGLAPAPTEDRVRRPRPRR